MEATIMTVKELITELLNHCDIDDDVYVNIMGDNGQLVFYSVDGLENSLYEYRNKPTLATLGVY